MRRLVITILFMLASCSVTKAQNSFYSDRALSPQSVIGIPQPVAAPIPYGSVRVCSLPLTQQQPCLPLATITDINGVTLSNAIGSNFGQLTTDVTGKFLFGCVNGVNYQVQIQQSASNTPALNYPITCPGGLGAGGLAGNLAFTGNNTHSGTETFANINKVIYADQQAGATADVKIANCLTALGGSGTCNATGFGATTQSLAAQVTVNSGQTILFDPATTFQASTAALNPFVVKVNAIVKGLHFDCGNQPTYSGNLFTFNDAYRDGNTTAVEDTRITCSGVTTGTAALLSSTGVAQPIVWIRLSHWRQFGLLNQVLLTASGNGFVNDNHFTDMQMTGGGGTSVQIHYTTNNGQLNANQCIQCSFESASATDLAELFDGTTGANDQASNNLYIGDGWDTTVAAINYSGNSKATLNQAIGFFNHGISDNNLTNGMNFPENIAVGAGLYIGGTPGQAGTTQITHNSSSTVSGVTGSNYCLFIAGTGAFQCLDVSGNLGIAGRIVGGSNLVAVGTACTNGELALSAGFGATATVTAVAGNGQTCHWTITSSGAGQAANPTITDTLTNPLPTATTVCDMRMEGGTGTSTLINQTTLSATAPVFTFNGTPVAASTYIVVRRCGP